jgi:hypothetical protein
VVKFCRTCHGEAARVQGASGFQPKEGCNEKKSPPDKRTQVHGNFLATADFLLALQELHMVRIYMEYVEITKVKWYLQGIGKARLPVSGLHLCRPQKMSRPGGYKVSRP